jgi:hypothetical protein
LSSMRGNFTQPDALYATSLIPIHFTQQNTSELTLRFLRILTRFKHLTHPNSIYRV